MTLRHLFEFCRGILEMLRERRVSNLLRRTCSCEYPYGMVELEIL